MVYPQFITFVLLAIIFGTLNRLLNKYVLKETDPYAFALMTQIISSIIFLPIAIINFSLPKSIEAYIVLAIASLLWALVSFSTYKSYKGTEVSIRDPLNQSKLIWTLILGILLLGELVTSNRIIGTVIMFIGISLLMWHPERKFGRFSDPGVKWTIGAAILSATVAIADKLSLRWFKPEVYGFLVYLFPMLILLAFLPKRSHHIRHLFKIRGKSAVITIFIATITYYFTLKAFSLADITLVYPLIQLSTLLTVIGGITLMKEKEHLWQRIIATIIIITGSIILSI